MDPKTEKLLTLAFDERTNESEAIVAFLKCRNRETLESIRNPSTKTAVFGIVNVPLEFFHTLHEWGYRQANICGLDGMQVRMKSAKSRPNSTQVADFYFHFDSGLNDAKFEEAMKDVIKQIKSKQVTSDLSREFESILRKYQPARRKGFFERVFGG